MSTQLNFGRDVQGYVTEAAYFATDQYSATITASTDTSVTVPSNVENWIAYFSYGNAISDETWVAINQAAAGTAGSTFASTTSCLRPRSKVVKAGDVIHFYAQSGTGVVGIEFYCLYSTYL